MTNYMNPQPGSRPPLGANFFNWVRSLGVRRGDDRWVGGVCSGIAARIGWDPLLVRIIWFATLFLGGFGLAVYGFVWMTLPDGRDGTILVEELAHGRLRSAFVMATLFVLIGLPATTALIPVLAIVLVCALIVALITGSRGSGGARSAFAAGAGATAGAAGAGAAQSSGTGNPYAYSQTPGTQPNASAAGFAGAPRAGQPYTGNPYAGQPYAQRPVPPVQPTRPTEVRRPAGPVIVGLMYGLVLISLALAVLWQMFAPSDYRAWGGSVSMQLWTLGVTAVTGLVLIVIGLMGRRTGGLMPLAVIALVLSLMVAGGAQIRFAIADGNLTSGIADGQDAVFTSVTYSARDYNRYGLGTNGLDATFSDVTLDLTDWESATGQECPDGTLETDVVFSNLTVVLPQGCSYSTAGLSQTFGAVGGSGAMSDGTGGSTLYINGDLAFGNVVVRQGKATVDPTVS